MPKKARASRGFMVTVRKGVPTFSPKDRVAFEQYQLVMQAAVRWSMSEDPESRLRWLLEFAKGKLEDLSPAERTERGEKLRWFQVKHSAPTSYFGPMPDEPLRRLHAEINRGLRTALGEGHETWFVPGPARLAFYRSTPRIKASPKGADVAPKRTIFNIRWDWGEGQEEAGILAGIIHLLQESGSRLRGCVECGRPFLAVKRQIYCPEPDGCAQRKRNRAKQQRSLARR